PRDSYRNAVVSGQKSKTPISPGYGRQNHKMCMMNYIPGQDQGNAIMLRNNTQKNLCREQGHIPSTSGIGNSQNKNKEYIKSMDGRWHKNIGKWNNNRWNLPTKGNRNYGKNGRI
ncbi:hypothetical protein HHI36_024383, partial [Cryptolaemus montrouzieri]